MDRCRLKKSSPLFVLVILLFTAYTVSAESDILGQSAAVPKSASDITEVQTILNLEQCINIALKNNPAVAQKKWDSETALAEKDIAQGKLWPEISAVGEYTHYLDDRLIKPRRPGTLEVLGFTDELISGDIVLNMPLYTGRKLRNEVEAAELITRSAKHRLFRSRRELVFNVSKVFYAMLAQQEVIDSLIFSQKNLEEHHKRVTELLAAQKAAKVDLLRTEVRLADIEQQLLRERNVFNIERFLLFALLGLDRQASQHVQVKGELKLLDLSENFDQELVIALNSRQDYQSMKARTAAQQKNLDVAKAGRLPKLSLRAAYGNRWAADSSEDNEVGQVGIFAVIPFFEGGRINARIRREGSQLSARKEALRKLRLQINLEVETAVSNIESTRARIGVTQKAIKQAKESLRIERQKYNLGKGAIIDVLDAQSSMLDSQKNYYRVLADYNTALCQFRLAVGEKQ